MRKPAMLASVLGLAVSAIVILDACNKHKEYDVITPLPQAHFIGAKTQNYIMSAATPPPFVLTIGTTDVASADRNVTLNISSPSGAVKGTHYTLSIPGNTITIPAGKATAALNIQGIYAQYTAGRKDTLLFTISAPDVEPARFSDTVRVVLRGPCFEGDVTLNSFLGAYPNTNELFGTSAYGPYLTTVSAVSSTGPTSGNITVTNIYDAGWNPIVFQLDWTNPAARTATLNAQSGIGNAGTLNTAYNGMDVSVRPWAGTTPPPPQIGTFSVCNQTIQLRMQLGVTGLGWFGSLYTVNMAR